MKKHSSILILFVIIGLVLIGKSYYAYGSQKSADDLDTLLLSEQSYFSESPTLIMSYYGDYEEAADTDDLLKKGTMLSELLGLPAGTLGMHKNTFSKYAVDFESDGHIRISLSLVRTPNRNQTALSLSILSQDPTSVPAMKALKAEIDNTLSNVITNPQWTTVIQGEFNSDMNGLLKGVTDQFRLTESNRYTDSGTLSISYHSRLGSPASVSASNETNFQLAVHRNSETGKTRLTLGTPAIPIEY